MKCVFISLYIVCIPPYRGFRHSGGVRHKHDLQISAIITLSVHSKRCVTRMIVVCAKNVLSEWRTWGGCGVSVRYVWRDITTHMPVCTNQALCVYYLSLTKRYITYISTIDVEFNTTIYGWHHHDLQVLS